MRNPIVGIGELLWDIFPDGRKVAGGAPFNFAFHCQQLGHDAVIVSRVGDDDLGRELRAEVRRLGLTDDFIQTDTKHPTGTVRVTVDAHGQPTYTITEDVAWDYIGDDGWPIDEGFAHDVVAVCYGTLAQRRPTSRSTIQGFVGHGVPAAALHVFDVNLRYPINRKSIRASLLLADWIKVNRAEWQEIGAAFNMPYTDVPEWLRQQDVNPEAIWIVSDGADGAWLDTPEDNYHEPGIPASVVDTVGAGDAFTAAMVCLHLEGRPLRECARFANHYAARVCEFQGATPRISRGDIERVAFG